MAEDPTKTVDKMTRSLGDIAKLLAKSQDHSEKMRIQWAEMQKHVDKTHSALARWLPPALEKATGWAARFGEKLKLASKDYEKELKAIQDRESFLGKQREQLQAAHRAATKNQNQAERLRIEAAQEANRTELDGLNKQRESLSEVQGLRRAINSDAGWASAIALKGLKETWAASRALNTTFIEANANLDERRRLMMDTWTLQTQMGASTETMAGAVKSLTDYGFDLRGDFKDMTKYVVQMKEGLGVSEAESVQLARVFGVSLKADVRTVADTISTIVNNTALAADEATRFASEIGRGIQNLMGLGGGGGGATTGLMLRMAGALKTGGGTPEDFVKMMRTMMGGSEQGVILRGIAGVSAGQMLTGDAGVRGIERFIKGMTQGKKGTDEYVIALEQAANILGLSTDTVQRWSQMIEDANKPRTEAQKLEDRWKEQVKGVSTGLERLINSLRTLYMRALSPLMPLFEGFVGLVTQLVDVLSGIPSGLLSALAIGGGGLAAARTGRRLWGGFGGAGPMELPGTGAGGGMLGRGMGWLRGLGAPGGALGAAGGILGAFGVGYGVGTVIDQVMSKYWSKNPLQTFANMIAEAHYVKAGTRTYVQGGGNFWGRTDVAMREAMQKGDVGGFRDKLLGISKDSELLNLFASGQYDAASFHKFWTEKFLPSTLETLQDARYRMSMRPGSVPMTQEEMDQAEALRQFAMSAQEMLRQGSLELEIVRQVAKELETRNKVSEAQHTSWEVEKLMRIQSEEAGKNLPRVP